MAEHVARAGKSKAKHLSQEISVALRERRWAEAATLLAELSRTSASNVKLGSLQRWTRDADACVDDDKAQWRALLWRRGCAQSDLSSLHPSSSRRSEPGSVLPVDGISKRHRIVDGINIHPRN